MERKPKKTQFLYVNSKEKERLYSVVVAKT